MDTSRPLFSIAFSLLLLCVTFVAIAVLIGRMLPKSDELALMYRETPSHLWEIYVMDIERTLAVRLLNPEYTASNPTWSPDGTQIAFVGDDADIYVFNLITSTVGRITNSQTPAGWDLDWSPDGTTIAFNSYDVDSFLQLFAINTDGSNYRQLTTLGGWQPSWSPDNRQIAFGCPGAPSGQICIMTFDVDNNIHIAPLHPDSRNPSWSPDGSQILSTCFTARDSLLCVMDTNGDNSVLLLENQYRTVNDPTWSSDGRFIVFVNSGDLYMTDPEGSNVRQLTNGNGQYSSPAWRP